jgi:predicted small integral membrane protein
MDLYKLSTGEKISAASGILLFVFMFFDWFGVEVSGVSGFSGTVPGAGGSAWDALDVIPIFLAIAIVAAVGVAVVRLTDADLEPAISLNAIVAVLGALAFLLILYRIVDPPGGGQFGGVSVDTTRQLGIFLGLLSAAGIAYGGYSAMREEGVTFGDAADRLGGGDPGTGSPPPPSQG